MSDSTPEVPSEKTALSRRSFVTKASLGAVAAGALVAAGPLTGRAEAATPDAKPVRTLPEPVVAQLSDVGSGAVRLHVGTRSFTVVDHTLAQHLARAVQG